jgi:hypothetical protein
MLEIPRRKLLGMTMAVFGFFTTQSIVIGEKKVSGFGVQVSGNCLKSEDRRQRAENSKTLNPKSEARNSKQIRMTKYNNDQKKNSLDLLLPFRICFI